MGPSSARCATFASPNAKLSTARHHGGLSSPSLISGSPPPPPPSFNIGQPLAISSSFLGPAGNLLRAPGARSSKALKTGCFRPHTIFFPRLEIQSYHPPSPQWGFDRTIFQISHPILANPQHTFFDSSIASSKAHGLSFPFPSQSFVSSTSRGSSSASGVSFDL